MWRFIKCDLLSKQACFPPPCICYVSTGSVNQLSKCWHQFDDQEYICLIELNSCFCSKPILFCTNSNVISFNNPQTCEGFEDSSGGMKIFFLYIIFCLIVVKLQWSLVRFLHTLSFESLGSVRFFFSFLRILIFSFSKDALNSWKVTLRGHISKKRKEKY